MNRSRRHRKPLIHRLNTWFQSYILFGRRRSQSNRRPSRLRRAMKKGYRNLSEKLTRILYPARRRRSRFARVARSLFSAEKQPFRAKPSRLISARLDRKIRRLNDQFLSWLFSYKPEKKTKPRPQPVQDSTPKIYQRLTAVHALNPIYWIGWSIEFCVSYLLSRHLVSAIPALPAILVLIAIPFIIAQVARTENSISRIRSYTVTYYRSLQSNDHATAAICNQTLRKLDPLNSQHQFERGRLESLRGQPTKSREIMEELLLQRKSGQAAAWLVELDYDLEKLDAWSEEDHKRFKQLMAIVIADPTIPSKKEPHLKLAFYFDQTGDPLAAFGEVEPLLPSHPELLLIAAEFAKKGNAEKKLGLLIPWAKRDLNERLAKSPQDVDILLRLSRILELNDEFEEAEELLSNRLPLINSRSLTERLGKVLVARAKQLATAPQTAAVVSERIRVLYRATKLAPNDFQMVLQLRDLILTLKREPALYQAALAEIAIQGKELKGLALIRACLLLLDQNETAARFDLQLAMRDRIDIGPLLNNLAVAMVQGENPDLLRALQLANAAVKEFPNPYFWETRGEILFRLKRYKECVVDLEKVVKYPMATTFSKRTLSIAHQILGYKADESLNHDTQQKIGGHRS